MKKLSIVILMSLATYAGLASAQTGASGITESTDPAKIAAIEQRAQQLAQAQTTTEPAGAKATDQAKPMPAKKPRKKHAAKKKKSTAQSAASGTPAATDMGKGGASSGASAPMSPAPAASSTSSMPSTSSSPSPSGSGTTSKPGS